MYLLGRHCLKLHQKCLNSFFSFNSSDNYYYSPQDCALQGVTVGVKRPEEKLIPPNKLLFISYARNLPNLVFFYHTSLKMYNMKAQVPLTVSERVFYVSNSRCFLVVYAVGLPGKVLPFQGRARSTAVGLSSSTVQILKSTLVDITTAKPKDGVTLMANSNTFIRRIQQ